MLEKDVVTKELMEALLKVIDEGIHVIDLSGKTILYNKVAASLDSMKAEEVIGKHLLRVFPSLTKKTSTLLSVIESGQAIYHKQQTYANIHGATIDTINTTLPIFVDRKLVGAVEIAKDISELRKLSERLIDLEKQNAPDIPLRKRGTGAFYHFHDIKTDNETFMNIIEMAKKASKSSSSILVFGESGSGKELFVQGVHNASPRKKGPFIAQNCAALPEALLESILFGTAKGSYTGAIDRPGLFELANGGTLFLDEIQSMSMSLQTALLRVIEDGVIRRVGATKNVAVDVRVIAAMNIHPEQALNENVLRLDLYYRLNVLSFQLPPLRERKEDILLLANYFIQGFNKSFQLKVLGMTKELEFQLLQHTWPGNVRELKHCIEYMMNVSDSSILQVQDLPVFFNQRSHERKSSTIPPLREALKEKEKQLLEMALQQTEGNVLKAAQLLQIPRQTLQYKLKNM
ncbi:sigma-54 interaction domain-containing protein [Bacillus massiliigorillae]|uniref:sigma-54 interaction domain-containing protein n=1 Tax=Bacillus massiliigorillae TaxID=1243664 RepID=UPI0003A652FE|nr:sigma 54-interacting transcriptional regulator [Bacillus massiliigorillae]